MKKFIQGLAVLGLLYLVGLSGTAFNKAAGVGEIGSQEGISDSLLHDGEGSYSQPFSAQSGLLMLQLKPNLEGSLLSLLQTNSVENFIFRPNSPTRETAKYSNQSIRTDSDKASDSDADEDLDGPEAIHQRNLDYRRRHGMDKNFDPNRRLQLVHQQYEMMEAEKAEQASRPDAIPGTNWVSIGPSNVAEIGRAHV